MTERVTLPIRTHISEEIMSLDMDFWSVENWIKWVHAWMLLGKTTSLVGPGQSLNASSRLFYLTFIAVVLTKLGLYNDRMKPLKSNEYKLFITTYLMLHFGNPFMKWMQSKYENNKDVRLTRWHEKGMHRHCSCVSQSTLSKTQARKFTPDIMWFI